MFLVPAAEARHAPAGETDGVVTVARRALVTGAGGFAGRFLVGRLRERGWTVTAAGHHAEETLDFRDPEATMDLVAACRPEVVFHLAATSSAAEFARDPTANHNVTTPAVHVLSAVLLSAGSSGGSSAGSLNPCRVVFVSSWEAYGRPQKLPIAEDHPLKPNTLYGASRASAEYLARTFLPRGLDLLVARPFPHTGPGQGRNSPLGGFVRRLAEGETKLPSARAERLDWSDVRDVIEGYIFVAEAGRTGATYNVCSGVGTTMGEVFDRLADREGFGEDVAKPGIPEVIGDNTALRKLGWAPRFSLAETLHDLKASLG